MSSIIQSLPVSSELPPTPAGDGDPSQPPSPNQNYTTLESAISALSQADQSQSHTAKSAAGLSLDVLDACHQAVQLAGGNEQSGNIDLDSALINAIPQLEKPENQIPEPQEIPEDLVIQGISVHPIATFLTSLKSPTTLSEVDTILKISSTPRSYQRVDKRLTEGYDPAEEEAIANLQADRIREGVDAVMTGKSQAADRPELIRPPPVTHELRVDVKILHPSALYRLEEFRRKKLKLDPLSVDFATYIDNKSLEPPPAPAAPLPPAASESASKPKPGRARKTPIADGEVQAAATETLIEDEDIPAVVIDPDTSADEDFELNAEEEADDIETEDETHQETTATSSRISTRSRPIQETSSSSQRRHSSRRSPAPRVKFEVNSEADEKRPDSSPHKKRRGRPRRNLNDSETAFSASPSASTSRIDPYSDFAGFMLCVLVPSPAYRALTEKEELEGLYPAMTPRKRARRQRRTSPVILEPIKTFRPVRKEKPMTRRRKRPHEDLDLESEDETEGIRTTQMDEDSGDVEEVPQEVENESEDPSEGRTENAKTQAAAGSPAKTGRGRPAKQKDTAHTTGETEEPPRTETSESMRDDLRDWDWMDDLL